MTQEPVRTIPELMALWRSRYQDKHFGDGDCADELERTLQAHPVVPLAELRAVREQEREGNQRIWLALDDLIAKYTPRSANPHPQGTYLWAREESVRGQRLRRGDWSPQVRAADDWNEMRFRHADFTATDWEVAP